MGTLFLIIIYLAFISLGLPDSILGSGWPAMRIELNAPLSMAGVISMIICGSTVISSFFSSVIIKKIGTGMTTLLSVLMTAIALMGFSYSQSLIFIILFSIPLGLGAGAIDAALNNYVARHYNAKHMSWLHCFWGVGATIGPVIMGQYINKDSSWRGAYFTIAIIQFILVFVLFFSLPYWKSSKTEGNKEIHKESKVNILRIVGIKPSLITFLFYCGVEATIGLWASSYLINVKDVSISEGARYASIFYLGITIGRFINGFVTMILSSKNIIRIGLGTIVLGAILLIFPMPIVISIMGIILLGVGCAPIYPSMLHETPNRFGEENSQKIMGIQMAVAYIGSTSFPVIFGFIFSHVSLMLYPFIIGICAITMVICSEKVNNIVKVIGKK